MAINEWYFITSNHEKEIPHYMYDLPTFERLKTSKIDGINQVSFISVQMKSNMRISVGSI